MQITATSFPPHLFEVIAPMATAAQLEILKPLYEAESAANNQASESDDEAERERLYAVQEQVSGIIWALNKAWGFLEN